MEEKIIYEEATSEYYLTEMSKEFPADGLDEYSFHCAFTPETTISDPYFKIYNGKDYSSSTKVARICFKKPMLVTGHKERHGEKEWQLKEIPTSILEDLKEYLNERSSKNSNVSVWTMLRYDWNASKNIPGFKNIEEYTKGVYDTPENLANILYVPYKIEIPNYSGLYNDPKGKAKHK